jgi:16S rRNA (uracil1498-N3)-methyltransferase
LQIVGRAFDEFVRPDAHDIVAAVGPEGGFTDEEIASAERGGFQRVSLGPHILRIETAAIAIAARSLPHCSP